jgi:hypothetical protein
MVGRPAALCILAVVVTDVAITLMYFMNLIPKE